MRLKRFRQPWGGPRGAGDRDAILEFNKSLALTADVDALMASIAERIREMFGANRIIILRELSENGIFTIAFSNGYEKSDLGGLHFTSKDRLSRWLHKNETALVVQDSQGVLNYLDLEERELLAALGVRICLPLIALNRLTGLLFLSSSDREWSLETERLGVLEMLVSQASIAFETADLYRQQRDRLRTLYRAERLAAVKQLAASIAHEVRNPLTAIRSTVQYLLGEFDEKSPKRTLVEGVITEVDRINRLVDGLLHLTRQPEFNRERLALGELIDRALLLVRNQAREQLVEIEWSPGNEEIFVVGDASQLRQLLLNVLLNALQAMPDGGSLKVELTKRLRTQSGSSDADWAEISIQDAGCGIPAEHLERIFDPFFTTKQGGTGLGIPISYAIAKRHRGEMEIESKEAAGTAVSVRLPLVR